MKAICLNLDSRQDRWKLVQKEFNEQGIEVERFSAIVNEDRFLSFNLSQQAILKSIKETTIVFEDDIMFVSDKLKHVLDNAPNDYDVLYLSGHVLAGLRRVNNSWWRCKNTHTTHSVIYTAKAAKFIHDRYDPYKDGIYDDWLLRVIQPMLKCYICKPFITTQRPGYSDLWQTETDYGILHTQSKLL
jgi:GR25 family glycosyltransferase involved in LPS biosynthesis